MNSNVDPGAALLLSRVDLFRHLAESDLETLAAQTQLQALKRGQLLMHVGEEGNAMFVVRAGRLKVFVSDEDGRELILHELGPGALVGDIALLDDAPRSASVAALESTQVLRIGKHELLRLLEHRPAIALGIIRSLTTRLREATESSRALALDTVYERLVTRFRELAAPLDEHGCGALPRRYSQQELASQIGASREMVGKLLADLLQGGYIEQRESIWWIVKRLPQKW